MRRRVAYGTGAMLELTATETFDLSLVARRANRFLWYNRAVSIAFGLGFVGALTANLAALTSSPTYQAVAVIATATLVFMLVFSFALVRSPPVRLDIDPMGLTFTFSSGRTQRISWAGEGPGLVLGDNRGSVAAIRRPQSMPFVVYAKMPPFGLWTYPLTSEAFCSLLESAAGAGLTVDPEGWGPVVAGRWIVRIRRSADRSAAT
jgi:hypothetical protein